MRYEHPRDAVGLGRFDARGPPVVDAEAGLP
jgi:hypothetical protein